MPFRPPDHKLTAVAFVRDLDPALYNLIEAVLESFHTALGSKWSNGFERGLDRLHFTILGLESVDVGGRLANYNALENDDRIAWCNYHGLLELFRLYQPDHAICSIRVGGYQPCSCNTGELADWHCRSSNIHSFGGSAYLRSFYLAGRKLMLTGWSVGSTEPTFDRALYHFRRRAESWGFRDKYHSSAHPAWQDDDFYGAIADLPLELDVERAKLLDAAEATRASLAGVEPVVIPVPLSAVTLVSYESEDFISISKKERLSDLIEMPERMDALLR